MRKMLSFFNWLDIFQADTSNSYEIEFKNKLFEVTLSLLIIIKEKLTRGMFGLQLCFEIGPAI